MTKFIEKPTAITPNRELQSDEYYASTQISETVCGTVQNINREGETARVMTLAELKETQVDMFTTVFIGNSQTRNIDGKNGNTKRI